MSWCHIRKIHQKKFGLEKLSNYIIIYLRVNGERGKVRGKSQRGKGQRGKSQRGKGQRGKGQRGKSQRGKGQRGKSQRGKGQRGKSQNIKCSTITYRFQIKCIK